MNQRVQRIVAGELRERLPTRGVDNPFDRLAVIVNGMLDEIEALVQSMAGAGDDIAHDLRTPLTRVRVGLERGRQNARSVEELRAAVDHAIVGLDQSLAIITALLRITEIAHSRRLAAFSQVALADLVREVGELYEPIAEDKRVAFTLAAHEDVVVRGDRDLLFEAIANLVDNAVKFTPEGGSVEVSLLAWATKASCVSATTDLASPPPNAISSRDASTVPIKAAATRGWVWPQPRRGHGQTARLPVLHFARPGMRGGDRRRAGEYLKRGGWRDAFHYV